MANQTFSLRIKSREDITATRDGGPTSEDIRDGCYMRIADAVEKMASSYDALRAERDRYKAYYEAEKSVARTRGNVIAGLKGAITRMKKAGR